MPQYSTADIRNVALVGHAGSGKTSLAEALLKHVGVIPQAGVVEKGDTVCDASDEERQRGHSLFNAVVPFDHDGRHINLVDTPGSPDFVGQALTVLGAVETAVVVINASAGIEPTTRRMMERAKAQSLAQMIVISRIDSDNLDLEALLEQIRESFGRECLPINLPAGGGKNIIDCFANDSGESDLGSVEEAHTALVEQIVEVDDALMEVYLEQGEVKTDQLEEPMRKAVKQGHLVPICFASGRNHDDPQTAVGVADLATALATLAPSPADVDGGSFVPEGGEASRSDADAGKPVLAHVFKIVNDRFGKLSAMRVHQGTITKDSQLHADGGKRPIKISHLYQLQGSEHNEMDRAVAGDMCAVVKVDELKLGTVLAEADGGDALRLDQLPFPQPMYGLAVTAKSRGDETKIGEALSRLDEEDVTFTVTRDPSTHETIINGMGDMHLRLVLDRLKAKYNVEVETKPPKIAYRETISINAEGHHRHKKQTGGAGQFGEVFLRVEPLERDTGFEFSNDIFGGSIPNQFIPAVEKGVRQVMVEGCVAGYPMQDIKVSIYDGKHHPVDSKEVAFVTAARRGFQDAVSKAKPVLLEPIVDVEITVPNANLGDIAGDLSGKRGRMQGTDMLPGDMAVIKARVPLAEMTNYQSQLKSVTGGQGSYAMELSHYDPVPANVQQQVVAQYKPKQEEE